MGPSMYYFSNFEIDYNINNYGIYGKIRNQDPNDYIL